MAPLWQPCWIRLHGEAPQPWRCLGKVFAREAEDATVFIVDDMISTGGTIPRAAEAWTKRGAMAVSAMATDGLFNKGAEVMLAHTVVKRTIVTA